MISWSHGVSKNHSVQKRGAYGNENGFQVETLGHKDVSPQQEQERLWSQLPQQQEEKQMQKDQSEEPQDEGNKKNYGKSQTSSRASYGGDGTRWSRCIMSNIIPDDIVVDNARSPISSFTMQAYERHGVERYLRRCSSGSSLRSRQQKKKKSRTSYNFKQPSSTGKNQKYHQHHHKRIPSYPASRWESCSSGSETSPYSPPVLRQTAKTPSELTTYELREEDGMKTTGIVVRQQQQQQRQSEPQIPSLPDCISPSSSRHHRPSLSPRSSPPPSPSSRPVFPILGQRQEDPKSFHTSNKQSTRTRMPVRRSSLDTFDIFQQRKPSLMQELNESNHSRSLSDMDYYHRNHADEEDDDHDDETTEEDTEVDDFMDADDEDEDDEEVASSPFRPRRTGGSSSHPTDTGSHQQLHDEIQCAYETNDLKAIDDLLTRVMNQIRLMENEHESDDHHY